MALAYVRVLVPQRVDAGVSYEDRVLRLRTGTRQAGTLQQGRIQCRLVQGRLVQCRLEQGRLIQGNNGWYNAGCTMQQGLLQCNRGCYKAAGADTMQLTVSKPRWYSAGPYNAGWYNAG